MVSTTNEANHGETKHYFGEVNRKEIILIMRIEVDDRCRVYMRRAGFKCTEATSCQQNGCLTSIGNFVEIESSRGYQK